MAKHHQSGEGKARKTPEKTKKTQILENPRKIPQDTEQILENPRKNPQHLQKS